MRVPSPELGPRGTAGGRRSSSRGGERGVPGLHGFTRSGELLVLPTLVRDRRVDILLAFGPAHASTGHLNQLATGRSGSLFFRVSGTKMSLILQECVFQPEEHHRNGSSSSSHNFGKLDCLPCLQPWRRSRSQNGEATGSSGVILAVP